MLFDCTFTTSARLTILQNFKNGIQLLACCIFIVWCIILLKWNFSTIRYKILPLSENMQFFHKGGFPMGPLIYPLIYTLYIKFNFSATINNIYAQFKPVKRGLYSACVMLQQFFECTYLRFGRMTWFQISKIYFVGAIGNINAHFATMNRWLNWAY